MTRYKYLSFYSFSINCSYFLFTYFYYILINHSYLFINASLFYLYNLYNNKDIAVLNF